MGQPRWTIRRPTQRSLRCGQRRCRPAWTGYAKFHRHCQGRWRASVSPVQVADGKVGRPSKALDHAHAQTAL
jgi:hypothetical protein